LDKHYACPMDDIPTSDSIDSVELALDRADKTLKVIEEHPMKNQVGQIHKMFENELKAKRRIHSALKGQLDNILENRSMFELKFLETQAMEFCKGVCDCAPLNNLGAYLLLQLT
jgi:hypothetical protein